MRLENACLLTHVGERAVAVVVIEDVRQRIKSLGRTHVRRLVGLLNGECVLAVREPPRRDGQVNHRIVFIGQQSADLLAVEPHVPGLLNVLLPEPECLLRSVSVGTKAKPT